MAREHEDLICGDVEEDESQSSVCAGCRRPLSNENRSVCKSCCPSRGNDPFPDGLPETIESDEPECPHCHLVHEMPEPLLEFNTINCECGWRFEAKRKIVIVSAPMEYRK